jgi:hypothetical protein
MAFHSSYLYHDTRLSRVYVNKFYGLDPMDWFTPLEHYSSLHGITDELEKLVTVYSIWILNDGNGGNGIKMHTKGMLFVHSLLLRFMNTLKLIPTI